MPNIAKPTRVKELAGNPGKRKVNKKEPRPLGLPTPPETLSAAALPIWQRLVMSMPEGVYAATDEHLLSAYCEQVVIFQTASVTLSTEPAVVTGSQGQLVPSPWVKILNEASRLISTLGAQLGLNPAARQSLAVEQPKQETNPFLTQ